MNTFLKTYEQVIKEQIVLGTLLLTLLKTGGKNSIKINCIPLDLLIVKLAAYRFDIHAWALILTYLKNQKKSIQINSTHSSFKNIISGAPQESTVGSILFNLLINDLFHIIKKASTFNFADDNTLSAFSKTIEGLFHILQSES